MFAVEYVFVICLGMGITIYFLFLLIVLSLGLYSGSNNDFPLALERVACVD